MKELKEFFRFMIDKRQRVDFKWIYLLCIIFNSGVLLDPELHQNATVITLAIAYAIYTYFSAVLAYFIFCVLHFIKEKIFNDFMNK